MRRIVIKNIKQEILLNDFVPYNIVIENSKYYYSLINTIINQINGVIDDEYVFYSDDAKFLNIKQESEIIYNPFDFSYNYKKLNNNINKYILSEIKKTQIYYDFNQLNAQITSYLEQIKEEIQLPITYNDSFEINDIIKVADFKYDFNEENILNKIVNYINILMEITDIKIIFLVGIKDILTYEEIKELYKEFSLKQLNLILIDSHVKYNKLLNERLIIIDEDLCEI